MQVYIDSPNHLMCRSGCELAVSPSTLETVEKNASDPRSEQPLSSAAWCVCFSFRIPPCVAHPSVSSLAAVVGGRIGGQQRSEGLTHAAAVCCVPRFCCLFALLSLFTLLLCRGELYPSRRLATSFADRRGSGDTTIHATERDDRPSDTELSRLTGDAEHNRARRGCSTGNRPRLTTRTSRTSATTQQTRATSAENHWSGRGR